MQTRDWVILSGRASCDLTRKICEKLGKPLGNSLIRQTSDGEISLQINENVRGKNVYLLQSTSPQVNDSLMELLLMVDALKRASAHEIIAVVPYLGYARQDRKVAPRTPITARLVADLLITAGVTKLLTIDLHADQTEGFFNIPLIHLTPVDLFVSYIKKNLLQNEKLILVSPDIAGIERTRIYADRLKLGMVIADCREFSPDEENSSMVLGDVREKTVCIIDDLIISGQTLIASTVKLKRLGAKKVFAIATHGVFSDDAIDQITQAPLEQVVITDTISPSDKAQACKKIKLFSIVNLLANTISSLQKQ